MGTQRSRMFYGKFRLKLVFMDGHVRNRLSPPSVAPHKTHQEVVSRCTASLSPLLSQGGPQGGGGTSPKAATKSEWNTPKLVLPGQLFSLHHLNKKGR